MGGSALMKLMVGKVYKIRAGPILRPRELRIGHEDEKMQVSIKTIVKERGKFSFKFNGLQWAYSKNGVLWKTFFSRFNRYLRFFRRHDLFSVRTNADRSCSNFTYISYH